jgi:hypothetical protein
MGIVFYQDFWNHHAGSVTAACQETLDSIDRYSAETGKPIFS